MTDSNSNLAIIETRKMGRDHPFVGALVSAIDKRLRRYHGVSEFTASSACIFRIQLGRIERDRVLRDGTRLRTSDRILDLHLWNEQLPRMPAEGPTLGWARRFTHLFDLSLRDLANYLAEQPDLEDIAAIRANISLAAPQQRDQLARIIAHFGFETIPASGPRPWRERVRRFGENILYSMMVYVTHAVALRRDALRRDRIVAFVSLRTLQRRYPPSHLPSHAQLECAD